MPTFSNSPIPSEDPAAEAVTPPPAEPQEPAAVADTVAEPTAPVEKASAVAEPAAPAEEASAMTEPTAPTEEASAVTEPTAPAEEASAVAEAFDTAPAPDGEAPRSPEAAQTPASEASQPRNAAFRTTPDDGVIIRNFSKAQPDAAEKVNRDFGLSLDSHGFTRLQRLFRDTLKREPTAGELRLLDAVDRAGRGQPDREAIGELYTDSPAIAETWGDMMRKHAALYDAEGKKRANARPAPPCTFEESLTLIGRYLHRAGRVLPVTDGLPFGGKNSDGRTVVLSAPWQEADALAEGYAPVARIESEGIARSVWVRKGPALTVTPEKSGDFLVYLPAAAPAAMQTLLEGERQKSHPALGDIRAVSRRSVLATVLSLCNGADIFADRIAGNGQTSSHGRLNVSPLCDRPSVPDDCRADYILRVPLKKVRELSDRLKALSIEAIAIGQVKSGDKLSVRIRIGNQDVPVAELPASVLREFPVTGLYRRRAEGAPQTDGEITPLSVTPLWRIPEAGLLTSAASVTVTRPGQGYPAALDAVNAAVAPLTSQGIPAHTVRLSVTLTAADGEQAPGDRTVEVLCGLYRAASERGMAVEDPAMTVTARPQDEEAAVTLTVAAWAPSTAALLNEEIPTAPAPAVPPEAIHTHTTTTATATTTTIEKGTSAMNHVFEPLKKKPRAVILDTDIGPDCDDVGALVCLIDYAKKYGFPILGICNCTSNKAGTGTIDAVCRHCGIETPYLGQWSGEGFQDDPACHKYNDAVAEKFSEAYRNGTLKVADEVTFYRTLLANAEDDGVMIVTIGMYNDLAALLTSGPDEISPLSGMELVKAKVNCMVSMAAILPEGRECNVISDFKAAETVFRDWPTAVYLSDFHVGWKIMTGYDHIQDPEAIASHPLAMAYHYYTRGWTHLPREGMNSSYDLTAVQFAVEGEGELYSLMDSVDLEFYAAIPEKPELADATRAVPNPEGKFRFMKKEAEDDVIRDTLNAILRSY